MRKRKGISVKTRWEIFKRDGFRCVYCGSQESLVIDHGDPFARGGEDGSANYLTACRLCNAGKRDSLFIPHDAEANDGCAVMRKGVEHKNSLMADWFVALSHTALGSVGVGQLRAIAFCGDDTAAVKVESDFFYKSFLHKYEQLHVFVFPLRDAGTLPEDEQLRIRNATVLGYTEPTMILLGSPWHFYGLIIDERRKGSPAGVSLDHRLEADENVWGCGWHPDENLDFMDPREAFVLRPHCVSHRGWHATTNEVFEEIKDEI